MPQYLLAGYLPDNFDPSTQDESIVENIHALNREMIAAGVRKFACGLGPARTLRAQTNGEVLVTDGPYLETKGFIGGFWILETANLDEALAWARKAPKRVARRWRCERFSLVPPPKTNKRQQQSRGTPWRLWSCRLKRSICAIRGIHPRNSTHAKKLSNINSAPSKLLF
jgi:hypothetical protein